MSFLLPEFPMIRPALREDITALTTLAEASGLFQPDELGFVVEMLGDYFDGKLGPDHFWIADDDGGPVGVAYVGQERLTEGTWNLYMIAVHPDRQGQGRGEAIVRHVEEMVLACGARQLIVETSGLPKFDRVRDFYRKCGYEEEARIRDFYRAGDDKVVYRKILTV